MGVSGVAFDNRRAVRVDHRVLLSERSQPVVEEERVSVAHVELFEASVGIGLLGPRKRILRGNRLAVHDACWLGRFLKVRPDRCDVETRSSDVSRVVVSRPTQTVAVSPAGSLISMSVCQRCCTFGSRRTRRTPQHYVITEELLDPREDGRVRAGHVQGAGDEPVPFAPVLRRRRVFEIAQNLATFLARKDGFGAIDPVGLELLMNGERHEGYEEIWTMQGTGPDPVYSCPSPSSCAIENRYPYTSGPIGRESSLHPSFGKILAPPPGPERA